MRVGIYQFAMADNPRENMTHIKTAVSEAARNGVELLFLPECALSGYPKEYPYTIEEVNFSEVENALNDLEELAADNDLYIVAGTAEYANGEYYNSAVLAIPNNKAYTIYRKRALWGWDAENFTPGDIVEGVFEKSGFRIGIRICYEVRFPEYFRELYSKNVDCAVVLFCDTSTDDSMERFDLIKAHLRTRAVENVFPILSVNSATKSQTAPTMAIDQNGSVVSELPRHNEELLIYELEKGTQISFAAKGRKHISDMLIK